MESLSLHQENTASEDARVPEKKVFHNSVGGRLLLNLYDQEGDQPLSIVLCIIIASPISLRTSSLNH
jgi:hypothetical protein